MWYVNKDYILIHQTYRIALTWHYFVEFIKKKYAMWKFIVDVVQDFVSSLQPDIGRGFLHVSNVFLLNYGVWGYWVGGGGVCFLDGGHIQPCGWVL